MGLIVQKFGGTSVADADCIRRVAGIITDTYKKGNQVVVVLSAMGKTTDGLIAQAAALSAPQVPSREQPQPPAIPKDAFSISLVIPRSGKAS